MKTTFSGFRCFGCGTEPGADFGGYVCPACGGNLEVRYAWPKGAPAGWWLDAARKDVFRYRALLPPFDATQVLLAGVRPAGVPAATIDALGTDCQPGRVLPNPLPDKKLIP